MPYCCVFTTDTVFMPSDSDKAKSFIETACYFRWAVYSRFCRMFKNTLTRNLSCKPELAVKHTCKIVCFIGRDALWTCKWVPVFRNNILPPCLGLLSSSAMTMEGVCMFVLNDAFYKSTLLRNPQDHRRRPRLYDTRKSQQ